MADVGSIRAKLELDIASFNRNLTLARQSMLQLSTTASLVSQAVEGIGNTSANGTRLTSSLAAARAQLQSTATSATATSLAINNIGNSQAFGPQFNQNINNATNGMNNLNSSVNRARASFGKIQQAAAGVGLAVAAIGGASIFTAAEFEKKLSGIKSVSGATAEEMEKLADLAKKSGAETAYSASEAADAISELLKSGLSVTQVLEGGLAGSLSLAAAGELELGAAAEIASVALNSFRDDGLSVAAAADILAGAASSSATDINGLKFGLSAVASVASSAGMNFKDTATALALLAQNGLAGSDSGTSLKSVLMNLSPSTKEATKLFEKLGIITKDGANHFYDAEGGLKSLSDVTGVLRNALDDLNPKERGDALEKMFGSDGVRAASILFKSGAEGIERMATAMGKITAADTAATKLDNLFGSVEELKGSLETAGIELGEGFLPALRTATDYITDLVRSLDSADLANAKTALAFAGVSSAIALVLSTLAKVGLALSAFALTPVGAAVLGLSILGGAFAALAMHQSESNEVTLDSVVALEEQRNELSKNISAYDALKSKTELTTRELGRFVDINAEITKSADPKVIAELTKEQDALREKSGLSNEQLDEMIRLNGEILKAVPESNTVLSEQGNVLLTNTSAAKKYNAEQLELIRLELEAKKAKAEANMSQYLLAEKNALAEMVELKKVMKGLDVDQELQIGVIAGLEIELATAKKKNDEGETNRLTFKLALETQKLEELKKQRAESAQAILDSQIEVDKIQAKIGKLDEVKRKMIDIELRQVGLNAKRGEELKTIDSAISKLQTEKQQIENNTNAADKTTAEYREAVGAIDNQITELGLVRGRVIGITSEAGNMNAALGKDINKTITINQRAGRTIAPIAGQGRGNVGSEFHTGGVLPKLHVGGLASQFMNAPSHNEIDIRALRGETILTEAQQANLHRMIDAGFTNGSASSNNAGTDPALVSAIKDLASRPVVVEVDGEEIAKASYSGINQRLTREFDNHLRMSGVKGR